ncbi:hypothetical protein QTO34_013577 [Cnephaeus nilssonii]|uniref:Glycosyltransferase 2-like domain-containing protein n=1 Tax=Cnephaeus nilssonii TaxID=3371016 RepID=A0AA40I851_CNENI|nr:hypothetical protein QTO34_013577 [Eptesicus nilssonii]
MADSGLSLQQRRRRQTLAGAKAWVPGAGGKPVLEAKGRKAYCTNLFVQRASSLSKSLGLIEGYGGRGKGGLPATLSPAEEEKAKGPHEKYGYNSYLSEKISLDRSIPDYRPTKGRERDRELETWMREKHRSAASCTPSTGDVPATQSGRERDRELETSMREKHRSAASCTLPTGVAPSAAADHQKRGSWVPVCSGTRPFRSLREPEASERPGAPAEKAPSSTAKSESVSFPLLTPHPEDLSNLPTASKWQTGIQSQGCSKSFRLQFYCCLYHIHPDTETVYGEHLEFSSATTSSWTRCKELKYSKELPQISIIFIFVNEALSVILRSVHSAVNHTPTHLLKEIILVDDNSDEDCNYDTKRNGLHSSSTRSNPKSVLKASPMIRLGTH